MFCLFFFFCKKNGLSLYDRVLDDVKLCAVPHTQLSCGEKQFEGFSVPLWARSGAQEEHPAVHITCTLHWVAILV